MLLESIAAFLKNFLASYWWVVIPPFLLLVFLDVWRIYRTEKYKHGIDWTLLELTIPKEVTKTPKAMEQIFAAMHAIQSEPSRWKKWLYGELPNWMSLELVGRGGDIHFFVRLPSEFRNLFEASLYAQYPEAIISVVDGVDDYVNQFSPTLPNDTYDIWGSEFILAKSNAYPIRTYPHFEEHEEERRIDPIAVITEIMSKLEGSEAIWIQILISPAGDDWVKKAEELINELQGKKKEQKLPTPLNWLGKFIEEFGHFMRNFIVASVEHPTWPESGEKKEEKKDEPRPAKRKAIDAIEDKISKFGFNTVIRFVYIDLCDKFTRSNIAGVIGSFKQFNIVNLNSIVPNKAAALSGKWPFKKQTVLRKKKILHARYRTRDFPSKTSIFNIEELATIFHFPLTTVKSPRLKRVAVKRGSPPPELPVESE